MQKMARLATTKTCAHLKASAGKGSVWALVRLTAMTITCARTIFVCQQLGAFTNTTRSLAMMGMRALWGIGVLVEDVLARF
jgi:hypothetical protein